MTANEDLQDQVTQGKSGDGPMTDVQRAQLDNLSEQTGEPTPGEHLSKAEAAKKIEELREEAGYDTSTDDLDEP